MRRSSLLVIITIVAGAVVGAAGGCVFYLNPQCSDLVQNGSETDIDCGGSCGPCTIGHSCSRGQDCNNGYCLAGTCEPLPCVNGRKDFDETDVDCGGGTCRKCSGARHCSLDSDCAGGHCDQGQCRSLRIVEFSEATAYPAELKTYALFAGDFNHDGNIDLVAANEEASTISMFLGRGDGTFDKLGSYPTGEYPTGGMVVDFNRDGNLDLLTANFHGNSVSVLLGNGDGSLGPVASYPTTPAGETSNLAVGDLNGDGYPDVIATNQGTGTVSEFMSRFDGTLGPSVTAPVGPQGLEHLPRPFSAAIGDFDEDGKNDMAALDNTFAALIVRLGKGDGTFGAEVDYPEGGTPPGIVMTYDMNFDGHLDLVVANRGTDDVAGNVSVLLGNGDGTFQAPIASPTGAGTNPYSLAVADFNQDGVPDVVTANFLSNNASVLIGVGDGSFEAPIIVGPTGNTSYGVVAEDLNGDGIPDLAVCNASSNDVTIMLSTSH